MPATGDIYAKEYSERAFVVRGNTVIYKEKLKEIGGKYNSRLRDSESEDGTSPGWIFPKTKLPIFNNFLKNKAPSADAGAENNSRRSEQVYTQPARPDSKEMECAGCRELNRKIDDLSKKMQKIVDFFEENEKMRNNMMSGASSMMKNMFGSPADILGRENFSPPEGVLGGGSNDRRMSPPSVTVIEELIEDEDKPTAILFS